MTPAAGALHWLFRVVAWSLGAALLGIAALATALYFGLADPPRAGPLLWQEDFKGDPGRWRFVTTGGATLAAQDGALAATFTAPGQTAFAVADAPPGEFTLEIAAAQTEGASGSAQYGLVFGWESATSYSAVLVNGNGYAEAYRLEQGARTDWFPFGQWPHLMYGAEANRVRVEVGATRVSARLNDELFFQQEAIELTGTKLGVLARSSGPGRVVFSWARVWAAR